MKKTVYLFDFDKTIICGDSIFLLWKYAISKHPHIISYFPYQMMSGQISYRSKKDFRYMKNALLSVLKYLDERELKDFVHHYLYPKYFFKDVFLRFQEFQNDGIKVLVSASAMNYLQYVSDILPFDYLIGSQLDNHYRLVGENNKDKRKVINIMELFQKEGIEINYETSQAYSDSYQHDHYMMELVKHRFLINSNFKKEGYVNLYWKV